MTWPNWFAIVTGSVSGQMVARNSGQNGVPIGISTHLAYGDGGTSYGFWNGRNCVQYFAATAAPPNGATDYLDAMSFNPAVVSGQGNMSPYGDDFAVTRLVAMVNYGPNPFVLFNGDAGLEVVNGNTMFKDGGQGFGFKITADNQVSFVARNGAGLTVDPVSDDIPGFDSTLWHAYELRVINPTPLTDAQVKVFIDNQYLATYSWGAGTKLPDPHQAAFHGFRPIMTSTTGRGFFVQSVRVMSAPTEAATL